MRRAPISLSFPPFTQAVKILIATNTAVFLIMLVLTATGHGDATRGIDDAFALRAYYVVHWRVYQLLSYGFLHAGFFHLLFNMLTLWMFGSMLETHFGSRQFWEFYLFGIFGAGVTSVVLAYTLGGIIQLLPETPTVGASGGIYAILMATAMLFGNTEVFLFPFPFLMKLKYLVAVLGVVALVGALGSPNSTANIAHLGGLFFGYLYLKLVPRRGLIFAFSESYYGVANSYYRWKRGRAARKFKVYMRKHNQDPKDYFDESGNLRLPEEKNNKENGEPGGWVN